MKENGFIFFKMGKLQMLFLGILVIAGILMGYFMTMEKGVIHSGVYKIEMKWMEKAGEPTILNIEYSARERNYDRLYFLWNSLNDSSQLAGISFKFSELIWKFGKGHHYEHYPESGVDLDKGLSIAVIKVNGLQEFEKNAQETEMYDLIKNKRLNASNIQSWLLENADFEYELDIQNIIPRRPGNYYSIDQEENRKLSSRIKRRWKWIKDKVGW